jgi:type I restriction-modification system DNA methylase subunit
MNMTLHGIPDADIQSDDTLPNPQNYAREEPRLLKILSHESDAP